MVSFGELIKRDNFHYLNLTLQCGILYENNTFLFFIENNPNFYLPSFLIRQLSQKKKTNVKLAAKRVAKQVLFT